MSIIKILTDKKTEDADKLTAVAEIVANARESYGNKDVEIPDVKLNTSHGNLGFSHLEDDSKIEILKNEALNIKAEATAYVEAHKGAVLNRRVEELLATNPFFANVAAGTEFEYL